MRRCGFRGSIFASGGALLALALTGCGGSTPAPATLQTPVPAPSTTLRGNWLLWGSIPQVGLLSPNTMSGMTVTFDVQQGVLTGSATAETTCGSGVASYEFGGLGGGLQGQVLRDGSFSASASGGFGTMLQVSGVSPATPGGPWSGTYTLSGGLGCTGTITGPIQATAISEVNGTYTGQAVVEFVGPTLASASAPTLPSTPLTFSTVLQQGAVFHAPGRAGDGVTTEIALGGTLQVAGLSCFSKGQSSLATPSEVEGSAVEATFVMDDGSTVALRGSLTDATARTLAVNTLLVSGGQCSGLYGLRSGSTLQR